VKRAQSELWKRLEQADQHRAKFVAPQGLDASIIRKLSDMRGEPAWMLDRRLAAYMRWREAVPPVWGPNLTGLDFTQLRYVVEPEAREAQRWEDVPEEIRATFEALGIPQAEREGLAGVGAQFDSGTVYHHVREDLVAQGVIFLNMDEALRLHPQIVERYFMTRCVPPHDHYFSLLHAAVWSGGTFLYVPEGVRVEIPLQAYFRMNAPSSGQFEHTLIIAEAGAEVHYIEGCSAPKYTQASLHAGCVEIFVGAGAKVTYSSFESWSKNTYNLNTKRAIVEADGEIVWLNGNVGSGVTMLYPMSVLLGDRSKSVYRGVALAGPGQCQDTGHKVACIGAETKAEAVSKSVSFGGGSATYRGLVRATRAAVGAEVHVRCDSLLLDARSTAQAIPVLDVAAPRSTVAHEAAVGRLSEDALWYGAARGLSAEVATSLLVTGYLADITHSLPLEYAVEFMALVQHELAQL
jgi:Fe-S cluster assembly protein SufB